MSSTSGQPIGIDLGTTNSAVAVLEGGLVRVIEDRLGEKLVPSVVALERESNALLVGRPAREMLALEPGRAAAEFKRAMGEEQRFRLGPHDLGAVELSACVLRRLREDACAALGREVDRCVITVPAYFGEEQRFATIKAGELAGLEVLRILNEPTAAAMAYGIHEREREGYFLVFDLGGGTFDVCVMERFAGILQVKSTAGESHLGGEDFTRRLVATVLTEVGMAYEAVELADPQALGLLTKRCELAKRRLSSEPLVRVPLPPFRGLLASEPELEVSRELAEQAWEPLLRRLLAPCRAALRGAGLAARDLDEVILVGGATRMPVVRSLARELFDREPVDRIDPDLTVVHGAAIQAALCARDEAVEDLVVTDVLSHSLGVETGKELAGRIVKGYFTPVIHRNTVIPTSRTEVFSPMSKGQTVIELTVLEGESRRAEGNHEIGSMKVTGIPGDGDDRSVEVRFTYDLNGVLEVEARVRATGAMFTRLFQRSSKSLSRGELKRARERISKLKEDPRDDPRIRDVLLRAELLWRELPPDGRQVLDVAIEVLEQRIETRNPGEIEEARQMLERLCEQIDGGERW